jgi:formate dehydrogenase maturation protein FdhE
MNVMSEQAGNCPECKTGDLVRITMTVAEKELSFTTCHFCEAKWWSREGEPMQLSSVLGFVSGN